MRKVLPYALAGLFALSACQSAGHDDPLEKSRSLNTEAAFPLHAYMSDTASDDAEVVGRAKWILAKQCMIRLGFAGFATLNTRSVESTYPIRRGTLTGDDMPGDDSPYGVVDPDLAAEHGYHNRQPDADRPQVWPADQYTALTGEVDSGDGRVAHGHPIPEGGCLGEATRKIFGPPPKARTVNGLKVSGNFSLALQLWSQARKQAGKDPAWKKAERAWSACMKKKGFRYPTPDKAWTDPAWFRSGTPSDKEKETATADARCKLDTGYVPALHALEVRAQKSFISKNEQRLQALRAADERAVRKARAIAENAS